MKAQLYCAILAVFLFSGICVAQVPEVGLNSPSNEVSVDFLVPVKGPDVSYGFGGQIASSHFINDHFGIKLQGDYVRTEYLDLHDAGVRVGPIVRFATTHVMQPYVEVLVGYARVESIYLKPATSFHGSGSVLAGGGFDFPLAGGWWAKAGIDVQDDWTAHTRAGRGLFGVVYRFGARQSRM